MAEILKDCRDIDGRLPGERIVLLTGMSDIAMISDSIPMFSDYDSKLSRSPNYLGIQTTRSPNHTDENGRSPNTLIESRYSQASRKP